jgi:SAM-dependent methyltransferase
VKATASQEDIARHGREILANRKSWDRKPLLRACYHEFYQAVGRRLNSTTDLPTLELGSGIGAIKEVVPGCVTSDIFDNPWLDRRENAYAIGYPPASLGNLILFDVFHHLEFPGSALQEFARVVAPGGRLLIFEPDMSLLGRLVYGFFHPEPLGLEKPISWSAPREIDAASGGYFAAQANATRIFCRREIDAWEAEWELLETARITNLRYFGSGGFGGMQLLPPVLERPLALCERLAAKLPSVFSSRLLIVLKRRNFS